MVEPRVCHTRQASGGLTYEELDEILKTTLSSGMAVGMEVTIFDPDLDPDGRIAAGFVEALAGAFARE